MTGYDNVTIDDVLLQLFELGDLETLEPFGGDASVSLALTDSLALEVAGLGLLVAEAELFLSCLPNLVLLLAQLVVVTGRPGTPGPSRLPGEGFLVEVRWVQDTLCLIILLGYG